MDMSRVFGETEKIRNAAYEYFKQGCNIVVLKGKQPLVSWSQWQKERQSQEEFESLPWIQADGFALIAGSKLDNGLFFNAVDYDVKNLSSEIVDRGKQALKGLPITQIEQTPSGGQHWVYFCHNKPKTVSAFHNECALELLGEGKLCIMAPSKGYKRLNDNTPTIVQNIESVFYNALFRVGVKAQKKTSTERVPYWFHKGLAAKTFRGKNPPCINMLLTGTTEGLRNESAIRVTSYMLNFKRVKPQKAWKQLLDWNRSNTPPLPELELKSVFESAMKNGYCFGCEDPLLNRFCVESNCVVFHHRMQVFKRLVAAL
jgi:hypothetical protein